MRFNRRSPHALMLPFVLALTIFLGGCSSLIGSVTQSFADDLSTAILDSQDIAMVRDGAPAYLILMDSLVARSPDDGNMLMQSATLNSAYASAFVEDEARAKLLHAKARRQALQATCLLLDDACDLARRPFAQFDSWLAEQSAADVATIYGLGTAWASWIQANSDDFSAIAELARVKALLQKASELQPDYEDGNIFLYLGVFETLFPPALGGKPEVGKAHFEEAIARSQGKNLLAKVMFAEQYARLVFNRELHDELLTQVLEADPNQPGFTLMNIVAQEQAKELMDSADEYF